MDDFAGQSNSANAHVSEQTGTSILKVGESLVCRIEQMAMRIPDAVRFTSLSRTRLFQMMADGKLRRIKQGRVTLIPVADLRALVTVKE